MVQSETIMAIYSDDSNEWRTIPTPTANIGPFTVSAWTGTEALFFSSGLPPGDPNAPDGIPAQFWSYTLSTDGIAPGPCLLGAGPGTGNRTRDRS
jgi:hypothetical protein